MKKVIASLALLLGLSAGSASAADQLAYEQFWLSPNAGTLGAGLEGGWRWNEYWGARAGINAFSAGFVYRQKNSDLYDRLMLLNAGVTADYYPFGGDFRLSAGGRIAANKIEGRMRNLRKHMNDGSFTIIANPLTDFTVTQNTFQPYLGMGYSVQVEKRVSLSLDFGALYSGTPHLSVDSRADKFGFTRREIRNEIEHSRDRIAPFKVYPVVQVGLNFKF